VSGVGKKLGRGIQAALSLEGLVGAMIGGAVWAIAWGLLTQYGDFRLAPALAIGGGSGVLATAGFLWGVVRPRRERAAREERTRLPKLKAAFDVFVEKGELIASDQRKQYVYSIDIAKRNIWRHNLTRLLTTVLGDPAVEEVLPASEAGNVDANLRRLRALISDLDKRALRDFDFEHLPLP
jgi:hypothetical protein